MLFFRHRLAVLPAMPATGDAFEDMLARELAANGDVAAGPSELTAGPAAAVLGNSYVEDLSKLGIGEVLSATAAVACACVGRACCDSSKGLSAVPAMLPCMRV